ncbi:MAG: DUF255 domain-containing protein [Phycisphaerales bacterium]
MNGRANRLASTASPYLLQHAHNPVDWRPWGDEAFNEARRRGVPIFLSIGYATCYWCHVMERESFESERIAAMMNERFVCVKVDREEHPEVDDAYMAATVMMTGHGGWPMSVFLEPATLKPFWCGTYFPAEPMAGLGSRPTFPQILGAIGDAWATRRDEVVEQAEQLAAAVAEELGTTRPRRQLSIETVSETVGALLKVFDRTRGGFGDAPKFPQPVYLELLMDVRDAAGDDSTADAVDEAVRRTLTAMMIGGIHDQVGGGFHRYSVDGEWTVPHFEKMLYDNAQLAAIYARAARHFGDRWFERTARRTLAFVMREMRGSDGLFFSAIDAEVDGREGKNYLWTPEQVAEVLSAEDAAWAGRVLGFDGQPNFRDPHHPGDAPVFVARLHDRPERVARELNMGEEEFGAKLDAVCTALLEARGKRPQPRLDDKAIASWNGLMIDAFVTAGVALNDPAYVGIAASAAEAAWLAFKGNGLARTKRGDRIGIGAGSLEDYAALMKAMASLVGADGAKATKWAARAMLLREMVKQKFMDGTGAAYDVEAGRGDLFLRNRSVHDGAVPSGSSLLLDALLELDRVAQEPAVGEDAVTLLESMSGHVAGSPVGSTHAVRSLLKILRRGMPGAERFVAPPEAAPAARAQGREDVVQIFAGDERIVVGVDQPAQTRLLFKIAPGWHIAGAEAEGLVPLRVVVVNGSGVAAYADYPAGEEYGSHTVGTTRVLRGDFEMSVAVELRGEWSGTPLLAVTYQACTDTECLAPTTVELDLAIDRA